MAAIWQWMTQMWERLPLPFREWTRRHWPEAGISVATIVAVAALLGTGAVPIDFDHKVNGTEYLRNVILLLVGAGAFPFAVWRSRSGQRQADGTAEQAGTAHLARLNEQFTAAATMLANDAITIRRLGLQSLQSLATDQPAEYYVRALRALCDYAREPYLRQNEEPYAIDRFGRLRSDVQAAVQAVGKAWDRDDERKIGLQKEEDYEPNLIGADLSEGRLWSLSLKGAHLERAICDSTVFADVNLDKVDMTRAKLPNADFTGRNIEDRGAKKPCSLKGAVLKNARCDGAHFSGVKLHHANLDGANLSGADFAAKTNPDGSIEVGPAQGLTQAQLDQACAEPDRPPKLDGVKDAETGAALVWRGQPCGDDSP